MRQRMHKPAHFYFSLLEYTSLHPLHSLFPPHHTQPTPGGSFCAWCTPTPSPPKCVNACANPAHFHFTLLKYISLHPLHPFLWTLSLLPSRTCTQMPMGNFFLFFCNI